MIRTGKQYFDGLRDGREVWMDGERVKDITVHPAFRPIVNLLLFPGSQTVMASIAGTIPANPQALVPDKLRAVLPALPVPDVYNVDWSAWWTSTTPTGRTRGLVRSRRAEPSTASSRIVRPAWKLGPRRKSSKEDWVDGVPAQFQPR